MAAGPRILAFDTSAAHCAAALLIGDRIVAERFEPMAKGQAERLMPMLEDVLADAGAVREELDAIGVGTGPGNFTGVRIAVAAARGLSLALGIPAVGVTGFEATRQRHAPGERDLLVSFDTRGGGLAWQAFAEGRPWGAPRFAESDEAIVDVRFAGRPPTVVGENAARLAFRLTERDVDRPDDPFHHEPRAFDVVLNGGRAFDAVDIATVAAKTLAEGRDIPRPVPVYVRPADALPPREAPPRVLP